MHFRINVIKILVSLGAVIFGVTCSAAISQAESHSGTISVTVDLSSHGSKDVAELWIPYPASDKDQNITNVNASGDYATAAVYTDSIYSTPMLYARWEKGTASRKLTFTFQARRNEVIRRNFPASEAAWDPVDYAFYLQGSKLGPIDSEVGKLAAKITAGKKTVLEKARAVYDWTCENTYRDPKTRGCGAGDVCSLLQKPGGSVPISTP